MENQAFSIYIHIPYCFQKCPYCDFNTYAVLNPPEKEYVGALQAEIDFRATTLKKPVQTIYFGGGTPSIFSPRSIKNILSTIQDNFPVLPTAEITLEANPTSISTDTLSALYQAGINRLSFGAQSFQSETLQTLGRTHNKDQVYSAISAAKDALFRNISIDLMVGVPKQTVHDVRNDVEQALDCEVPHVSMYSLTIEKGTPFYQSSKRGILKTPSDETVLEMISAVESTLELANLNRYEISNFALHGYESRHNLAYWNGDNYLGFGAGAHSFLNKNRWSNYALPAKYIEAATTQGHADSWREELTLKSQVFEYFFLGLRKIAGVSLANFETKFNVSIDKVYGDIIDILVREGFLIKESDFLRLSAKGINIADTVIENFSNPEI